MPDTDHTHRIKDELPGVLVFLLVIWVSFTLSLVFPLHQYGLHPRRISGLVGIVTMPFLHTSLQHIVSNSLPLLVLLALLAGSRVNSWLTVATIALVSGALLWLFGRSALHVGASGLVFGLAAFLLVFGFLERRFVSLAISLAVGAMYGSTLLLGVLPSAPGVSWDGHLSGIVAGILTAYLMKPRTNA